VKDNKENVKSVSNSFVHEVEIPTPIDELPKKDSKKEQEERELLEVSMLDDIDDDFVMEPEPVKPVETVKTAVVKTLSTKPVDVESTIFNELQGIDFETELREEAEGKIDWNTVS
jgi:hypothetical protein